MATVDGSFSERSLDQIDDADVIGVINALERICELESKLRQAVQQTHPLTTSLDWDFDAADRERQALLAIRWGRSTHTLRMRPSLRLCRVHPDHNCDA